MSLIWHIAKKDIRRMALPVALWLAFVVAAAVWFAVSAGTGMVVTAADVETWASMAKTAGVWFMLIQGTMCFFLVGAMVLEDPLVGTTAFWTTRPISNFSRATSTVVAALLLFVVVPVAVLMPVWCFGGFSGTEIASAIMCLAETQIGLVLLATATAGVSRNLTQFLFLSVGLLIAVMLIVSPLIDPSGGDSHTPNLRIARSLLLRDAIWPVLIIVAGHQFLTRRIRRTWWLVGIAVAAGFAVRLFWPWDSGDLFSWRRWAQMEASRPESRNNEGIVIEAEMTKNHGWQNWPNALRVTTPSKSDNLLVPLDGSAEVRAERTNGPIARFKLAGLSPEDVGQLALGRPLTSAHWLLPLVDPGLAPTSVPDANSIRVWVAGNAGELLGVDSIPFAPGEVSAGSRRTRVVSVENRDDGTTYILLEERGAFPNGNLFHGISVGRSPLGFQHRDIFALVNAATHETRVLRCEDLGAADFDSMITGFRRIIVPSELRTGSWRSASIVRIRIELGRGFHATRDIEFSVKTL